MFNETTFNLEAVIERLSKLKHAALLKKNVT